MSFRVSIVDPPDLDDLRALFLEYADEWPGPDLITEGFDAEIKALPGAYSRPRGALIIARADSIAAGCVALRPRGRRIVELKRLFVRKRYRGQKLGRELISYALRAAVARHYREVRLETLPEMTAAVRLYQEMGFQASPPAAHQSTLVMHLSLIDNAFCKR